MDAYPEDYVAHNLPLILLSGIEPAPDHVANKPEVRYPLLQEKGTPIESDFPLLSGRLVEDLRTAFLQQDASDAPWNSRSHTGRSIGIGLRIKIIGRVGQRAVRFGTIWTSACVRLHSALGNSQHFCALNEHDGLAFFFLMI